LPPLPLIKAGEKNTIAMTAPIVSQTIDPALARDLVLDELFDLTLYQELAKNAHGETKRILNELVPVETGHLDFWQRFFDLKLERLDIARRVKLRALVVICYLLGENAVHLILEAIEIYGVKKYLSLWETYRDQPLGNAVRDILTDEFKHEDAIVLQMAERKIDPAKIRSIFLGFNDGLVEIIGAVSGFFAAFHQPAQVLIAASTVAFAGAASMAAGTFVAMGSETEIERVEQGKKRFLGETKGADKIPGSAAGAALIVGVSYLLGAGVPVLPVFFGAQTLLAPLLAGFAVIIVVSFLAGMNIKRRILTNAGLMAAAVAVTYLIGTAVKALFGIAV
jgi:vacuolar iron transporter family protein